MGILDFGSIAVRPMLRPFEEDDNQELLSRAKQALVKASQFVSGSTLRAIFQNGPIKKTRWYFNVRDIPLKTWDRRSDCYLYLDSVKDQTTDQKRGSGYR